MPALDSVITALTIAKAATAGIPVPGLSTAFEYALAIAEKAKEIEDLQDDCRVLAERAANFLLDVNEQLKLCNGNVVSKDHIQSLICVFDRCPASTLLDIENLMHRRLSRKDKKGRFIRMLRDQDEITNEVKALNVKLDDCLRTFATRATIDLDQRMDVLTNANVHFLQYVEDSARIGSLVLAETRGLRADVASLSTRQVLDRRESPIVNTNRDRSGALDSSEDEDSVEVDLFRIVGLLNGRGRYSGFRIFGRVGDTVWDWRFAFSLWKSPTTPSCGLVYGSLPRAALSHAGLSCISLRWYMRSGVDKKGLRWSRKVSEASVARLCVVSPPLPRDAGGGAKVILWNIEGHDQGWGGEPGCKGTFIGAYSWYEACIFRKSTGPADPGASDHRDKEFWDQFIASQDALYTHPDDIIPDIRPLGYTVVPHGDGQTTWLVQRNRVARRTCGRYEVKWDDRAPSSYIDSILTWMYQWNDTYKGQQATMGGYGIGKGFLDALRPGDRVGLWARAQYSGWENVLRDATVKICF